MLVNREQFCRVGFPNAFQKSRILARILLSACCHTKERRTFASSVSWCSRNERNRKKTCKDEFIFHVVLFNRRFCPLGVQKH